MEIAVNRSDKIAFAYRDLYSRYADDASFLWVLRSIVVDQPHYYAADLAELEQRIQAQLDGLMTAPDIGWDACAEGLNQREPGEVFTAMVIAMRSRDTKKIQQSVQAGLSDALATPGLISALGWISVDLAAPWIDKFLTSKDKRHKYLGIAACSVCRIDPADRLTNILEREDCRAQLPLYARALRLVGELRRQDLIPALRLAHTSENPTIRFWALWSAILIGDHAAAAELYPYVAAPGKLQHHAIQLAFRVLPVEQAKNWITTLAKESTQERAIVEATGVLGDPYAVDWVLSKMTDPKLARLAGEAYSAITGADLEVHQLTREPPTDLTPIPNDDPEDDDVSMDADENLPWPDADKATALWQRHGHHFLVGQRYFIGRPLAADYLTHKLHHGNQRQRHAAALELALMGEMSLPNTYARISS